VRKRLSALDHRREPGEPNQCQMNGGEHGTLGQDISYALRNLRKAPGFAAVAVITLALGIGASTAIFSVIDNILMEPFPYPDAQRFMSVQSMTRNERSPAGGEGSAGRSSWIMWSRITFLTA